MYVYADKQERYKVIINIVFTRNFVNCLLMFLKVQNYFGFKLNCHR